MTGTEGIWAEFGHDVFEILNTRGTWVQTVRVGSSTKVMICRSASVSSPDLSTIYEYRRYLPGNRLAVGIASVHILLSDASRLRISPLADSGTVSPGGSAQLHANVLGGVPPYTYQWADKEGFIVNDLDDPYIADPTTNPLFKGKRYNVVVDDAILQRAVGSVVVGVNVSLAADATPSAIDVGGSSQLVVTPSGGIAPFTFEWTEMNSLLGPLKCAPGSLSAADVANPIASPQFSTVYRVFATAATGEDSSTSGTVAVNVSASASASQYVIAPGASTTLMAAGRGGEPPYTYAWAPVDSLDDSTSPNPIATPSQTTTYTVTVIDQAGASAPAQTTVTIGIPPFTVTASAMPASIRGQPPENGDESNLDAIPTGGTAPTPMLGLQATLCGMPTLRIQRPNPTSRRPSP